MKAATWISPALMENSVNLTTCHTLVTSLCSCDMLYLSFPSLLFVLQPNTRCATRTVAMASGA